MVADAERPLVVSPFVLAELDYLILRLGGVRVEVEFLNEVARGAYQLAAFDREDVEAATRLVEQYEDLAIGLADASNVVLAHRFQTMSLLTLDERHFRVIPGPFGQPFRLLPADL